MPENEERRVPGTRLSVSTDAFGLAVEEPVRAVVEPVVSVGLVAAQLVAVGVDRKLLVERDLREVLGERRSGGHVARLAVCLGDLVPAGLEARVNRGVALE